MKPLTLSVMCVILAEAGATLIMFNAPLHAPPGFWLWFGGIAALSPAAGVWLCRHLVAQV